MKSTVESEEGVAVWGFSADWTEVQYSKWWRGVGAAVQQVRPAGDSASTRFFKVSKGFVQLPLVTENKNVCQILDLVVEFLLNWVTF